MARFITFTDRKQTSSGESTSIVFVNIDLISTARYREDGSLSVTLHGTRHSTVAVEHYVLTGKEAEEAMNVLRDAR